MMSLNIGTSDICSFTRHALKVGGTRIKGNRKSWPHVLPSPYSPTPTFVVTPESIRIKETIQWKAGNQTEVTPLSSWYNEKVPTFYGFVLLRNYKVPVLRLLSTSFHLHTSLTPVPQVHKQHEPSQGTQCSLQPWLLTLPTTEDPKSEY